MTPELQPIKTNLVNPPLSTTAQENPHAIRWGYGAGLLFAQVPVRESGQQTELIEQGVFVAFADFSYPVDNPNYSAGNNEDGFASDEMTRQFEVTARDAIDNVKQYFAVKDSDKGFREIEVLTGVQDRLLLAKIEKIVNPTFQELGHECPEKLQVCPTCRLDFLDEETFLNKRIATLAPQYQVDVSLCFAVADALRAANISLLTHYSTEWNQIKQEVKKAEKGEAGVRVLYPEHHYIRQCLHEIAPEEQQAEIVTAYGTALAGAMADTNRQNAEMFSEAIQAAQGSSNEKFLMVMEQMRIQNEQQTELLRQLINKPDAARTEQSKKEKNDGRTK